MFNILTEDLKNDLKKAYKTRFWVLVFSIFNFLLIIFLLSLIPSYFILNDEKNNLKVQYDLLSQKSVSNDYSLTRKIFKDTNNFLNFLSLNNDKPFVYDFVADISNIKNNNIQVKNIMLNRLNATSSVITISGVALNREALTTFVKNIENKKTLKIDVPVSNFAKDKDIDFSFDIKANI